MSWFVVYAKSTDRASNYRIYSAKARGVRAMRVCCVGVGVVVCGKMRLLTIVDN